jgi:transcriptional regulator with XRE-family HTH domain
LSIPLPKLIKQIAYDGRIIVDMTIGERLRERRQQIGLSLGQVGEYEGLTPQYLSDLERGRNQPNVWSLLTRLAKRYRTTTDYLLGLTDDPDPVRAENRAQEAALLAQLPGPERAIVRALLLVLARETPGERQFTLEVIERLLLPAPPHIIGEEPDEPTETTAPPDEAQPGQPA